MACVFSRKCPTSRHKQIDCQCFSAGRGFSLRLTLERTQHSNFPTWSSKTVSAIREFGSSSATDHRACLEYRTRPQLRQNGRRRRHKPIQTPPPLFLLLLSILLSPALKHTRKAKFLAQRDAKRETQRMNARRCKGTGSAIGSGSICMLCLGIPGLISILSFTLGAEKVGNFYAHSYGLVLSWGVQRSIFFPPSSFFFFRCVPPKSQAICP